jgi:hypothetical protein
VFIDDGSTGRPVAWSGALGRPWVTTAPPTPAMAHLQRAFMLTMAANSVYVDGRGILFWSRDQGQTWVQPSDRGA